MRDASRRSTIYSWLEFYFSSTRVQNFSNLLSYVESSRAVHVWCKQISWHHESEPCLFFWGLQGDCIMRSFLPILIKTARKDKKCDDARSRTSENWKFNSITVGWDEERSQIEVKMSSQTERVVNPVIFRIFWQSARRSFSSSSCKTRNFGTKNTTSFALPVIKIR